MDSALTQSADLSQVESLETTVNATSEGISAGHLQLSIQQKVRGVNGHFIQRRRQFIGCFAHASGQHFAPKRMANADGPQGENCWSRRYNIT
jgi:hypothetical protein